MTQGQPKAERDRAVAAVTGCGQQLWRAQEQAHRAEETLHRALRTVDEAEVALGDASRRLARMDAFVARAGPGMLRQLVPAGPTGTLRLLA